MVPFFVVAATLVFVDSRFFRCICGLSEIKAGENSFFLYRFAFAHRRRANLPKTILHEHSVSFS